jgi:hypothetical protein
MLQNIPVRWYWVGYGETRFQALEPGTVVSYRSLGEVVATDYQIGDGVGLLPFEAEQLFTCTRDEASAIVTKRAAPLVKLGYRLGLSDGSLWVWVRRQMGDLGMGYASIKMEPRFSVWEQSAAFDHLPREVSVEL